MAKSRQSKRDADVASVYGAGLKFGINTHGINETLRALRRMERDTYVKLRNELVEEAQPLAQAVGAAFPAVKPLEGWHTSGRRGLSRLPGYSPRLAVKGVKPKAGTGLARGGGMTILRLQQMNAGGQVYDSAGSQSATQFVHNLDKHLRVKSKQNGFRSRVMYGATRKNFALAEAGVRKVIDKLERETERRLTEGIGGLF